MEINIRNPSPEILKFEHDVVECYPNIKRRKVNLPNGNLKLAYYLSVEIECYGKHELKISIENKLSPKVFSEKPKKKKHTYSDNSLCMWFPKDGEDRRWVFDDGLLSLINLAAVHLFKENYWNEYDEWLGEEAPHSPIDTPKKNTISEAISLKR